MGLHPVQESESGLLVVGRVKQQSYNKQSKYLKKYT